MKKEINYEKWIFWSPELKRVCQIGIKKPIICKVCGKEIKGNFVKYSYSFDLYHPKCMKKSQIKMVYLDEAKNVDNKTWEILKNRLNNN